MKTEIMPIYNNIMIRPYKENPYADQVTASGLKLGSGEFTNPDSGEDDTLDTFVGCAKIIETGPEVKYLKVGDDVYYDTRTVYPVPFMSLGYRLTTEPQILCVLNENLKERFNELKR